MARRRVILGLTALALGMAACGDDTTVVVRAGGDTTVDDRTSNAFRLPAANLSAAELEQHLAGDVAFESTFVTGDAPVNGGLGPIFNNTSCRNCHNRDGRGLPEIGPAGPVSQSLVRVSLPDDAGEPGEPGGAVPLPLVGTQLQDHAVFGVEPEATIDLQWVEEDGEYGDGTPYALRRPDLAIVLAGEAPLPAGAMTSLRMPPAVFGLGLLEAIPTETLEAQADPADADGDGISGRLNYAWDTLAQEAAVGRFGVKANNPNLPQQSAAAYVNDMGISNPMFAEDGDVHDIDADTLGSAAFYVRTLGVPARLPLDEESTRGEALFATMQCTGCHVPTTTTGEHEVAALEFQDIAPYTDLLIHDMGDGLADGRPDFEADGQEWRTPPLWGLGCVQTVLPGATYLHDGRARTFAEAILWHGGEAEAAREAFRTASRVDREALIAFLQSL